MLMNFVNALPSTLEQGLIYALLAMGVLITYTILDFPDLSVDGTFPLGACVTGALIASGAHPVAALCASFGCGLLAGLVTGLLHVRLKITDLLSGLLVMTGLWSVNLVVLGGKLGYTLLAVVWGVAILGMTIKAVWITCPKWFSSVIYIAMGWICLAVFGQLWNTLPRAAFIWLLAGGLIYTIGGIIYALKLPIFNSKHKYFGSHEIFHLFVMGGSICHFIFMFKYVA